MFYKFALCIVRFITFFIFRIKTVGKENIPKDGGVIIAYNHRSYWDPVIAGLTSGRRLCFMAKEELFKPPVFGPLIRKLGAFPVKRDSGDISAVKTAFKILGGGNAMLIFPEGRRITDGRKVKAKQGVAMIASRAKVSVIPANISGKYAWLHKIAVTYGKPVTFEDGKKLNQEELQAAADKILGDIRALGQS